MHRDSDRGARGRDMVAGLYADNVRALPRFDGHVEMARRVGDLRQQRQIGRIQATIGVGLHEALVALLPISARRRIARELEAHRELP